MSGGFVMGFDAVVVPPDASKSVLQQRIAELVAQHGGVRPAARVLEVDQGYVYRLLSGEKNDPGDKLLRKLKLRRIVTYERTDAAALATQAQQGEADLRKRFVDWWDTTHGDTKGPAFKAIAWEAVQGVATPSAPARLAVRMLTLAEVGEVMQSLGIAVDGRFVMTRSSWPDGTGSGFGDVDAALDRKFCEVNALTIGEPAALPKEMNDAND